MATPAYPDTRLLIANEWVDAHDGKILEVTNPATGQVIGTVAHAGIVDLDRALSAAHSGFTIWRDMSVYERADIMRRAASMLRQRADEIATCLTLENGKPLAEAKGEVKAGAEIIEWFADEGRRVYGRIVPGRNTSAQQWVLKEPVGPVAAFTPWNFPINQIVRKLGAALATGCSFLCKAPEETPASPAALLSCFVEAGIPPGVVGLVFGNPAQISEYLIPHRVIQKVTFTGSTVVGKQLAGLAGRHMKRVTMELGGHAPVIVAEDADIELAVKVASTSKFRNAGQVCISPTRFLVHRKVADAFIQGMTQYAQSLKVGDGLATETTMGPLANPRRVVAMEDMVADARQLGARILTGGERMGSAGNFYSPTIIADIPLESKLFNAEPFGPIAGVRVFDQLEEAIAEANRLPYGLAAYAFTRSVRNVRLLSSRVETGMLWINQPSAPSAELPFGGIKDSGYGTEGGPEALEAYLNTKTVSVSS
ncbi:MAG TPA: NAD-dependent succinate-semialdehyde dehydrogenase [Pusillimonas sp.]|uniref:NAD-dependent succinate-semialdehyde dehydrogenase n=1 Tax=unclassified Pusillimonas TaxID=2640016 RepID=UPI00260CC366|nr:MULTISPECIES: NAD-dependent succinate-semialdehyde dehydrogenase [unclassified Pusillimonas]HLU19184.1 NAD-dependent succinate-semialdehyde dehydrogenase [Pusillimonas sp.]